ncbi:MAG: serine/threonine-protein kinase, partial [Schlesneria sp.]
MSIDFQRIGDIFQTVAELPVPERSAVLDRECAGDTELRRRVEALLKAHDDSGELPAVEPLSTNSQAQREIPADELEQTIGYVQPVEPGLVFAGRYKLREKLGEGGMGVVFVADQIAPVQRRVALKVIRSGLDTRQLLARFEQERQALALMDHPNIAKVFDAGIDEAHRPYFAMELVKGLPLTKYCDEAKLSPRQRIELFIPVCQAVQHAHQKGIIHRDLKPSNILVGLYDGRPVPKVIDFGVAKVTGTRLTDQSVYTEIGSIIGTLEYMSPEQAELNNLDIDTRSNVYALGVILYELLTGTVPFSRKELEKAGLAEMLRVIKEEEPHKPSTKLSSSVKLPSIAASRQTEPKKLTALVRGELDWIVMKALEKDRARRYETANGLGQDVQRYLTGEPVLAAPVSTAYRLRKLIRRNKGPVIAGSLVFAALLIGMAGTTWGLFRAEYHREIAEQNADKASAAAAAEKEAKERAEANFILAKESVEKYLGTVTDDPDLKQADFHQLRKKLLESALPFFEKIAEQTSDDPQVEVRRGQAFWRLAAVRDAMGDDEAAIQDYESMRTIFVQLCKKFPADPKHHQHLAHSQIGLGTLLAALGKPTEAELDYRQAMLIREKLATEFPTVPEYRNDSAGCQNSLGNFL